MTSVGEPGSTDPVFVVGCGRSGTSVLAWALAQHPAFATGPESNFLYALLTNGVRTAFKFGAAHEHGWLRSNRVAYPEFASAIGFGVQALFTSRKPGKRWVHSTTEDTLVVEELALMFPRARFLHIVRDGRAVVASLMASGFDAYFAKDFESACRTWVQYVSVAMAFQQAHPARMLEVRNETMSDDCERVLEFLGAAPDDGVAKYLKGQRINSSFAKDGELKPSAERWQDWTPEQVQVFDEIAGPTLRKLGYT